MAKYKILQQITGIVPERCDRYMTQDPLTLYKLIILYMLDKAQFKLTYSQISNFILEKEYTNFMTLQQVIADLQDTELIKTETSLNRTFFFITEDGRNTLSYFKHRISNAIINDIHTFFSEKRFELKTEASISARYFKIPLGTYQVELIAQEKNTELANIKLSVPTEDIAKTICENWYKQNQQIYGYLMETLL